MKITKTVDVIVAETLAAPRYPGINSTEKRNLNHDKITEEEKELLSKKLESILNSTDYQIKFTDISTFESTYRLEFHPECTVTISRKS